MAFSVEVRGRADEVLACGLVPASVARRFPGHEAEEFPILRYLDEYGDTYFNVLQVRALLSELAALRAESEEDGADFDKLIEMARLAAEEPHRFLIFIGD